MRTRRRNLALLALIPLVLAVPPVLAGMPGGPDLAAPAARDTEPVVLTGASFPSWAAPAEVTAKVPSVAGVQCTDGANDCSHSKYEDPEVASGDKLGAGVAVDKLLGYRWNEHARKFVQIPFQVDELANRYLSNNASTFSVYSQTDQHPTYVFDEERFRWFGQDPADPCHAVPLDGKRSTPDPVPGLDTDDELAFMASDAGPAAPADAALPKGVTGTYRVQVTDPYRPDTPSYVYVMKADGPKAQKPEYTAANGYVRYLPDADSDTFLFSESAYDSYGNAPKGAWYDEATGTCVTSPAKQHRPKDTAWIKTPRYSFRYDGRWLMTEVHVAPKDTPWHYGPDIVDQWKARAFQQRPGGDTPCCGYEEEVNNWGGSSVLMGWRAGPVRVIRATWGSDSATNNVRTEIFYRDEVRLNEHLRVHVIPPGDGIYAQWDFNAGKVSTYYNPMVPDGVKVDGKNDEVFGNTDMHVASDGLHVVDGDPVPVVGPQDVTVGQPGKGCPNDACIDNDVDVPDPTFSGATPLNYEQVSGPYGTWIDRNTVKRVTAGAAYSVVTVPYYRDDSCFDDGTGTDPGLHVKPRGVDPDVDSTGAKRRCWTPADGDPWSIQPRDRFYQGDIGTHGIHIELIADSDNAFTTQPLDEIDSEQRIVLLPGNQPNVGERYGRATEKPLATIVTPM